MISPQCVRIMVKPVDIWSNNGNLVTIHLTGVDTTTEIALQANTVSDTVFGSY
jgi:hypothetical protein